MAPTAGELATLRALTFRVSSTPASQLPQHVPAIAASLANCRTILSTAQPAGSKVTSPEWSLAVHKYRTLLSTLLQHRTIHGRWAAIVLIKATVEVGGWETLQKCLPWVRGLLGILNKPDPPTSKKLCIITLTRIFLLTREYPTLVREITTPSLPALVQSGLQILSSSGPPALVQTVLECFNELLPKHPTMFRSYLKQLQHLLAPFIAATPSSSLSQEQYPAFRFAPSFQIMQAARQLHVQIPCCAPKGASSEAWTKSLQCTITSAHRVADRVFRAVVEDWTSTTREEVAVNSYTWDDETHGLDKDDMGIPAWSGIFAGGERLHGLLQLVKEHLESPTTDAVSVNLAAIMDLTARILSLNVPTASTKNSYHAMKPNNQVSREERESLWLLLPGIHVAVIEVLLALVNRSRASALVLDSLIIDQLFWVFASEKDIMQIRAACYVLLATLLTRSGTVLPKTTIDSLVPLIKACCEDLLPSDVVNGSIKQTAGQAKPNGNGQPQATANADTFLNAMKGADNRAAGIRGLKEAASDLLPILLTCIRAQYLSVSVRTRLDRTAVLIQHKDAMIASVLTPPPTKKFGKPAASILPLCARSFPREKVVEAILRPRMPVIRRGDHGLEDMDETDDMELEKEDVVEGQELQNKDDDHFVGQALETILSAEAADNIVQDFAMRNALDLTTGTASSDMNNHGDFKKVCLGSESMSLDSGKRAFDDQVLPEPVKRVKTGEAGQPILHPEQPALTVIAALNDVSSDISVLVAPDSMAVSTARRVAELPEAELGDGDSDEDDLGPLILGPDTDDESE